MNFGGIYGQGAAGLVQSTWAQFDLVLDPMEANGWLQAFETAYYGSRSGDAITTGAARADITL